MTAQGPSTMDRSSINLNLAVGGSWPGNVDGRTVFPGEMQVDYVRIYTN